MSAEMPLIDIRPDHWAIVRRILQKHVPQYAVWAFGSRAKWSAKEYSDLDLAIITDKPLPLSVSTALEEDFSESDLPWKVDVVDWAATSESFRMVIERDRVVVQTPNEMNGWRETTLGEVCRLQGGTIQTGPFGSQLHAADYTSIGTPVVMPVNLSAGSISDDGIARVSEENADRLARHKLLPSDIVFSRRGDVTRFALVSERESGWLCGTGCLKVSVGSSSIATPGFVAAVLASPESKEWLIRHAVGATMPNLNTEILASIPITLPPINEQRAIAHILGTLDDKIELNRKQNETLEATAQAIFKAWFVDFEPVHAKMEGRWQRGQSLPGLPAHLYDLFPDRLIESELGEIPEGWRHSTIGEEVAVCGGSTPSTKEPKFWEGGQHCWATPKDLSTLKFPVLLGTDRKITDAGLARISSGLLPVGTVLLSSRAPIGYLAIAEVPTAINQGFIAMKCDGILPNTFVLQWCRENMDAIIGNANGSTFQEISKSNFRPIPVVVPSKPVLEGYQALSGSLYQQIADNERQSRTLAQLRDTLLPKLISGELRIQNIRAVEKNSRKGIFHAV